MATRPDPPPLTDELKKSRGLHVFVESNTSGSGRLFVQVARSLGYGPLLLSTDAARYPYAQTDGVPDWKMETADGEGVTEACRRLNEIHPVAGITSSSEYFIGTAAAAARALGLPGPDPDAIERCRNKESQRRFFAEAGIPSVRFAGASTADEAVTAAEEIGLPVVIKPVQGTASIGVRHCADAASVRANAEALLAVTENERGLPVPRRVLVEEWVQGDEVSVEIFHGRSLGVTRKHPTALPFFVADQHDFPDNCAARIEETALAAVRALDLTWGPMHVELTVTQKGPRLIEVNPRLAGAYLPKLVKLARGVDMVRAIIVAGTGGEPDLTPTREGFASICFVMRPGKGRLAEIAGVDKAAAMPGVQEVEMRIRPGESLERIGDFRDRIGSVIAVGDDPEEARRRAREARAVIRLRTEETT